MNWQEAALNARLHPPEWALNLLAAMAVPSSGQWHIVSGHYWRYSTGGMTFNLRKLVSENPASFFGPWATLEHVCSGCGKVYSSTGIHDQAELGAVLEHWPPVCSCVSRETMEG